MGTVAIYDPKPTKTFVPSTNVCSTRNLDFIGQAVFEKMFEINGHNMYIHVGTEADTPPGS